MKGEQEAWKLPDFLAGDILIRFCWWEAPAPDQQMEGRSEPYFWQHLGCSSMAAPAQVSPVVPAASVTVAPGSSSTGSAAPELATAHVGSQAPAQEP